MWEQYERIIKDEGAIVLFCSEPFSSKLRFSKLRFSNLDNFREELILVKNKAGSRLRSNKRIIYKLKNMLYFNLFLCYNLIETFIKRG